MVACDLLPYLLPGLTFCPLLALAGAKPLKSKRFSLAYKQEYDTWTGFWDKQKVPEQQDVPELRARLAHLLGLGAGRLEPL